MDIEHYHVIYILTKLELGGAQKVCLALMDGLASNHIPNTLISGTEGALVSETKKFDSVILLPTLKREVAFSALFTELKNFITLVTTLRQLKKQHGLLVIHTHSTKAGLVGRWAALCAGISCRIHTIHGYGFHDKQSRLSWTATYLCELITGFITTHFVCVSEKDRLTGIRLFPRFARKSSIIRAAVDYEKFTSIIPSRTTSWQSSETKETFVIGTISCFKPQKNLFDLLNAFQQVYIRCQAHRIPSPKLHIIGDGRGRGEIEEWITVHQLTNDIILLGWQKDIAPFIASWNLFALSSLWEGLPMAVVEARLCKIPVVAYNVGGIYEVIYNDKNGFLIPPGDYNQLAEKIYTIINKPSLWSRLSIYQDALNDFHTSTMVQKHIGLYHTLANKNYDL